MKGGLPVEKNTTTRSTSHQQEIKKLRLADRVGKDVHNVLGLGGVGDKHLEDMERLVLDGVVLVAKQTHDKHKVGTIGNIPNHNVEVDLVQQQLAKELQAHEQRHTSQHHE